MAAEYGADDRRWCRYFYRDWSGKDTGRLFKEDQSNGHGYEH